MSDADASAQRLGRQAVIVFPARVTGASAGRAGEDLIAAISQGTPVVIADLSATTSCDRAGADQLLHAYQRALLHNVDLRLVAAGTTVRRVLAQEGLDRLVPVYPALDAARAANGQAGATRTGQLSLAGPGTLASAAGPAAWLPAGHSGPQAGLGLTAVVLRQLIDALSDGVVLTDQAGTIVLANRQLSTMFGYDPGELTGQLVDILVPPELRSAHGEYRAAYARAPSVRPMGERVRLVGLRKDGGTVPVTITLTPVPTADGLLVLAIVRAVAPSFGQADLADLARAAARRADQAETLLDRVVRGLFHVGLSLQAAVDQPADLARDRIADALHRLDDTIHEIRSHVFGAAGDNGSAGHY